MSVEDWRLLWAKSEPHHLLWRHLLDAAAVCEALLPCFGGVPGLPDRWVCLFVGSHDVGKADPEFQIKDAALGQKLRDAGVPVADSQCRFRHEARSAECLSHWLRERGWRPRAVSLVSTAINGHHGNFQAKTNQLSECEAEWWKVTREAMLALLASLVQPEPLVVERFPQASVSALKLSALTVLSDWVASNPDLYPYPTLSRYDDPQEYYAAARALAREQVRALGFTADPAPASELPLRFRELFTPEQFPQMQNPRPLQCELDRLAAAGELSPGLVIIEDRMGEGKSEAALFVAEHWSRLRGTVGAYIALPTAATSNQMHVRYRAFLAKTRGGTAPRLIHGMAWLVEEDAPREPGQTYDDPSGQASREIRRWFRSTRRALLAQEGVGTVDQALMAALFVRFGFLRLLGLSRKILVVDEVHAYDEYMTLILERLLNWCRALEIPVILLSATLSQRQKLRLLAAYGAELPQEHGQAYPLITVAASGKRSRAWPVTVEARAPEHVRVVPHPGYLDDPAAIAALAGEQVTEGGCCCVLMNTVGGAQGVFKRLRKLQQRGILPADTALILFHARFRAGARSKREDDVVSLFGKDAGTGGRPARPRRAILVATQVVEQSLDVDFDVMLSQVAPIDLLLQRAGRVHRHSGRERYGHRDAVLHVLLPGVDLDFGATAFVYANREPLLRSYALVHAARTIACPQDFRGLITACYDDSGPVPEGIVSVAELAAAHTTWEAKDREASVAAKDHLLAEPDPDHPHFTARDPAVEGEEGEPLTRLRARTRLGDTTARVLVLHDGEGAALLQQAECPPMRELRRLLRNHAAIPAWWLNAQPAEGYAALEFAPDWLRGYRLLRLWNGEWRGTGGRREARPLSIRDDEELGLELCREERDDDFDV